MLYVALNWIVTNFVARYSKRFIAQPVSAAMQSSRTQEPGDLGPEIMITELTEPNWTELHRARPLLENGSPGFYGPSV